MHKYSIAIHGGAGTILRKSMTPESEKAHKSALHEAISAGMAVLSSEGTALDAVETAVRLLEDNHLFNAGKGSVFTADGKNEMDACIMDGLTLKAGAVACVRNIRNPVSLAKKVMMESEHVLLTGEGALEFAKSLKVEMEPDDYFFDAHRFEQLKIARTIGQTVLDHMDDKEKKFGTVGAVALDVHGNLAAATSTGGMTNKKFGRIGDSPLAGIGNYANNNTCAISCTGHGEFFMRAVVAYDISCLIEYKGLSLKEACDLVVMDKLIKMGGEGGLIAVDRQGNIELPFNSEGMYRAKKQGDDEIRIGFYKELLD
jgi:L-asparaginase / beta-aspartyl-peptidase